METPMQGENEPKKSEEMQQQERNVEKGPDAENAKMGIPVHGGIDSLKLRRGLLSFRSRKLLGSLAKSSSSGGGASHGVDRPSGRLGVNLGGASPSKVGSASKEAGNGEGSKNQGRRELWDPRRVESEAAEARARLAEQRSRRKKKQQQQQQELQREKEGAELGEQAPEEDLQGLRQEPVKDSLPPRLKLLEAFYEGLEAASSLLRIRHQMCTFRAVRKIVESMSKRRFLIKHLAQMKHLVSEVMQLDYVRHQDPDSWGEKWDLRITLLPLPSDCAHAHTRSPLKGSAGQTGATIKRRKEFRTRLKSFAANNPEDSDLPQAPLPARPLGGQRPSSPDRHPESSHPKSEDLEASERKLAADVAESTAGAVTSALEEPNVSAEFEFSVVKPTSGAYVETQSPDNISHFPAPFTPYFSVPRLPPHCVASEPDADLPSSGSHLQSSFRPFFSLKPPHPQSGNLAEPIRSNTNFNSGSYPGTSCSDHRTDPASDSNPLPRGRVRPPRSTRPFSSSSKDLALPDSVHPSPSQSGPYFPEESPVHCPPHTPNTDLVASVAKAPQKDQPNQFLSPTTRTQTPAAPGFMTPEESRDLRTHTTQKVFESRTQLSPQKSQGVMRSLKFGSPAKSVTFADSAKDSADLMSSGTPSKAVNSTPLANASSKLSQPTTPGCSIPSTPCTPAQTFPSKPRTMRDVTPITPLAPATPLTPSAWEGLSNDDSLAKNLASRCLQFSTPDKASCGDELTMNLKTRGSPDAGSPCPTSATAVAKSLDVETSESGCRGRSSPQDIYGSSSSPVAASDKELKSPAKIARLKEVLCSPPKRTKLSLASHSRHVGGNEVKYHDSVEFVPREDKSGAVSSSGIDELEVEVVPVGSTAPSLSRIARESPTNFTAASSPQSISTSPVRISNASPSKLPGASPSRLTRASPSKVTGASPSILANASLSKLTSASPSRLSSASPSKLVSASPSISSLSVTESTRRLSKSDLDILQSLPPELVQSVQEKERKLNDETRRELVKQRRRQQMIGGIPKLFNQLRLIFQSMNRSVLPRQELVKSILSSHPDITDIGEVEERLQLVAELAPDYITTVHSQSGGVLYRIDKRANVVQIQRRLSSVC